MSHAIDGDSTANPEATPDAAGKAGGGAKGSGKKDWKRRRTRSRSSLFASGEPMVWLTGGALAICTFMVAGLLSLVLWKGLSTFWVVPVTQLTTHDGRVYMGEITRDDDYRPTDNVIAALEDETAEKALEELEANDGWAHRQLMRTGNYRLTQSHFSWVNEWEVASREQPEWAMVIERLEWGRFYGTPKAFVLTSLLHEKKSDGSSKSIEELRAEARDLADELSPGAADEGYEVKLLDERFVSGRNQPVLVDLSELGTASGLLGVSRVYSGPEAAWDRFRDHHAEVQERFEERRRLEKIDTGEINHEQEQARLAVRAVELELEDAAGTDAEERLRQKLAKAETELEEVTAWANEEFARIRQDIDAINRENERYKLLMTTAGEGERPPEDVMLGLADISRAYPANRVGLGSRLGIYLGRWAEFLSDEPREANSEGGVFPAIFGTVAMTLIMSILVVPFGVLAALYLREYATAGPLTSAVRIAVNNLAGVPSIVFGVFGLGFFCYTVGASIDELFFAANLPNPTYGKGGIMWAAFTLALLTLPVVIVATEEAVSAVPNSMREGSYACGASKWQTIQRIVLPRALPGIITGMILAIARGAGEVAPLMLVGAVKLAPELPIDSLFPYIHPERSFMHLGFHIYDVGFQSQNSEAAKPMVYTTTMLLISIVAVLNFTTIWIRNRLRRKFAGGQF
jgi:phosphate transport system permease protein